MRIRIFESLSEPFGLYLAKMGHWRRGLAVSRVSQSTVRCRVHAPRCFVSGRHLSSCHRNHGPLWGLRRATASSDGKPPQSERCTENHDRHGAVDDAHERWSRKMERKPFWWRSSSRALTSLSLAKFQQAFLLQTVNIRKQATNILRQVHGMHNDKCVLGVAQHTVSLGGKACPWFDWGRPEACVIYPPVGESKLSPGCTNGVIRG